MRQFTEFSTESLLIPASSVGPFVPVSEWDASIFNDVISDEVDSCYASSICCCDSCYDDFRYRWPGVAFRNMDFQTNSVEVLWFIKNSRIADLYSPAELSTLQHFVKCPRCNEFIWANIWIYEHRFSNSEALELEIEELNQLGDRTPFLLLEHPLATKVLEQVRALVSTCKPVTLPPSLFRARTSSSIAHHKQSPNDITSYGHAPAGLVSEGRFNHAGSPMLYLASSAKTAALEISAPDEVTCVAEIEFNLRDLLILDLVDLDEDDSSVEIFSAVANSALLSAPRTGTGWLRKQYVFSRFFADCAKSAGFDVIRYGSTKDLEGSNYVLLEPKGSIEASGRLVSWRTMPADSA